MSSSDDTSVLTARTVLFGAQGQQELAAVLHEQGVLRGFGGTLATLSSVGRQAVAREVGGVAGHMVALDPLDVLVAGWRRHRALTDAARRTLEAAGSEEVLDLANHVVTSVHRPYVELLVGEQRIATVNFTLKVELTVRGVVATIRAGCLVALDSGRCDVVATLSVEGVQIARDERRLPTPVLRLKLGDTGLALLRPNRAAALDDEGHPLPVGEDAPTARIDRLR